MMRPRIYGPEAKCRAALRRYIERGEELLARAEGVRKRVETLRNERRVLGRTDAYLVEREWATAFRRWMASAARGMTDFLQEQMPETLGVLARGLPPDDGKPRHSIVLDNGEPWLEAALDELKELQAALGVRRGVEPTAPPSERFEELHDSGLLDDRVIADRAREMRSPRTPKELYNAIGAAKELTEATLRAALDLLGESVAKNDDLPVLMKKWRLATAKLAAPDPEGKEMLDGALAALANLVRFVAEWRNAYGRGHGRPQYPPGLKPRHARLAADAAETCVRFIVTTMDDLELLPPRG
jgi:Abortive infection C-terminus